MHCDVYQVHIVELSFILHIDIEHLPQYKLFVDVQSIVSLLPN